VILLDYPRIKLYRANHPICLRAYVRACVCSHVVPSVRACDRAERRKGLMRLIEGLVDDYKMAD